MRSQVGFCIKAAVLNKSKHIFETVQPEDSACGIPIVQSGLDY